jgi:hypothetical protein
MKEERKKRRWTATAAASVVLLMPAAYWRAVGQQTGDCRAETDKQIAPNKGIYTRVHQGRRFASNCTDAGRPKDLNRAQ